MSKTFCAMAAALLLLTTMQASAHHAFAATYDENRLVTVYGIVTKFEWTNPHAWLYIDGKDESGKVGSGLSALILKFRGPRGDSSS
jgi:ABC-type oligopeptide transport system substrate-binding subunit